MLHAAGLVFSGRAWLLAGAEGAGKSTWGRLGQEAGGLLLSDDIVLVDTTAPVVEVLAAPFRSTGGAELGPGRWPVAGLLFPVHGRAPAWANADPLLSRARLAANLPFVNTALERDGRIADVIERLASRLTCRDFTFAPEPSFVDLLLGEADRREG
jgi:hypothetical protein